LIVDARRTPHGSKAPTQQNEGEELMSRDRNTYAKRQRETKKKQKAEDKRARRVKRKEEPTLEPTLTPVAEPDERLAEVQ
jgi:hypothetical protein